MLHMIPCSLVFAGLGAQAMQLVGRNRPVLWTEWLACSELHDLSLVVPNILKLAQNTNDLSTWTATSIHFIGRRYLPALSRVIARVPQWHVGAPVHCQIGSTQQGRRRQGWQGQGRKGGFTWRWKRSWRLWEGQVRGRGWRPWGQRGARVQWARSSWGPPATGHASCRRCAR